MNLTSTRPFPDTTAPQQDSKSVVNDSGKTNNVRSEDPSIQLSRHSETDKESIPLQNRSLKKSKNPNESDQRKIYTKIIELADDSEKTNDYKKLRFFLNNSTILKFVELMSDEEKLTLTQRLFEKNKVTDRKSFRTRVGIYLFTQQSPIYASQATPKEYSATSQPNWLVTRLGLEHPETSSVYSEELLNHLEQANYSHQQKTELLPPVLVQASGCTGISLLELSESSLIFPELFLNKRFCDNTASMKKEFLEWFKAAVNEEIPDPDMQKKVFSCCEKMMDVTSHLPVLSKLGENLTLQFERKNVSIPEDSVADRYSVRTFTAKKKRAPEYSRDHTACLFDGYLSQTPIHPYLAGYGEKGRFFSRKDTRDSLRTAMNEVCKESGSELQTGSSPVFIGYIHPAIAGSVASKNGFLDSNWSMNFLHGKFSHSLALTTLAQLAQLDRETLTTIVNNDLWNLILDTDPYQHVDTATPSDHKHYMLGKDAFERINCSAFKYHTLLTTGQLSASLCHIKDVIGLYPEERQAELLADFSIKMGLEGPLDMDKLTEMTNNIRVLEMVVSTKHLNSIERVREVFPSFFKTQGTNDLYCPDDFFDDGKFGFFLDDFSKACQEKAKKYLAKGYSVYGVKFPHDCTKEELAANPEGHLVTTVEELEAYPYFIAYPETCHSSPDKAKLF